MSERSVRRIVREAEPAEPLDDADERKRRGIGRPSKVERFRPRLEQLLQNQPDLPTLELRRLIPEDGLVGGKSQLYRLVATPRPKEVKQL